MAAAVAVVALLPWWHNHTYLRDFYDYGLVIAGNGRILAGERPYTDFVTPIQSGMFWANLAAERLFGGSFLAMTWGAAAAIAAAAIGGTLVLARRWPVWLAGLVTAAVVTGSLSQHTIIWHNAMGVVCLAAVTWSGAVAPVWRLSQWPWHVLTAGGLLLGGVNKLNFHLLALAVAIGWVVRARAAGEAERPRCLLSLGWLVLVGAVAPVALELAWTRASLGAWWYNVVTLPLAERGGNLELLFSWAELWRPAHNYYGSLSVSPVGMLCLVAAGGAAAAAWRRGDRRAGTCALAAGGGLLAAAGSLALLVTNFEIAYVALAVAIALAAGLWLGHDAAPRGLLFLTTLVTPAAILLGAAWDSAWRGQRSQFGHAASPRSAYSDVRRNGPAFAYLRGLRIPPEWADSLRPLEQTLPLARADGTRPVFFGQGLEWLERVYPTVKHKGLPLWMHFGTSYGPRETEELVALLADGTQFTSYYMAIPWLYVPEPVAAALRQRYDFAQFAAYMGHWTRRVIMDVPTGPAGADTDGGSFRPLQAALGNNDAIYLLNLIGGSINPLHLEVRGRAVTVFPRTEHSGPVIGVTEEWASLRTGPGLRRLQGEAVGRRRTPGSEALIAKFAARAADTGATLWAEEVRLEAGAREKAIPFIIRGDGKPLELVIDIPPAQRGRLEAGFRQVFVQQSDEGTAEPPRLRPNAPPDATPELEGLRRLIPGGAWRLTDAVVRGATVQGGELLFPPGAECWIRPDRPLAELAGEFRRAPSDASGNPVLRFVWSRGPHLELLDQQGLPLRAEQARFRGWSPEPDGWFGLLADPGATTAPALIRFTATAP